MRPDHDEPEQLAVAGLVDRLDPADGLVLHHRARVRDPREDADRDVVAVLLARLGLGQPDAGDLRVGVDRPRHAARRRRRPRGPSRSRPRPRPRGTRCARAASSRRSRRPRRCAGRSSGGARRRRSPCAGRARRRSPRGRAPRRAARGRPRRASGRRRPSRRLRSGRRSEPPLSSTFVHCFSRLQRDPALAELLRELLGRVLVLHRDQPRQHLDDRHLGAEAPEDRGELAADDPAAEDDEPAPAPCPGRAARSSRRRAASRARRSAGAPETSRWRRSRS